jgi:hypothetical protein
MKHFFKIYFLFTFVAFTRTNVDAQTQDTSISKKRYVNFSLLTERTYRTLEASGDVSWLKEALDSLEKPRIVNGFQLNLGLRKRIGPNLAAGLLFSDQGERTAKTKTIDQIRYKNHFYMLGLRCGVDYGIQENKRRWFGSLSAIPTYLLKTKSEITAASSEQSKAYTTHTDLKRFTFAAEISAGLQFDATSNCQFVIAPYYRASFTSITTSQLKKHFFAYGINIGFNLFF